MICPRCKNQDPKYFYTFNNTSYCRKCIHIGLKNETISNTVKKVNLNVSINNSFSTKAKKNLDSQVNGIAWTFSPDYTSLSDSLYNKECNF